VPRQTGQLFVDHSVEQVTAALTLDVDPDRLAGDFLHRAAFELGPPSEGFGLLPVSRRVIATDPSDSAGTWWVSARPPWCSVGRGGDYWRQAE
jgi:hypothetical protein